MYQKLSTLPISNSKFKSFYLLLNATHIDIFIYILYLQKKNILFMMFFHILYIYISIYFFPIKYFYIFCLFYHNTHTYLIYISFRIARVCYRVITVIKHWIPHWILNANLNSNYQNTTRIMFPGSKNIYKVSFFLLWG